MTTITSEENTTILVWFIMFDVFNWTDDSCAYVARVRQSCEGFGAARHTAVNFLSLRYTAD
jgi:hypothetical protein